MPPASRPFSYSPFGYDEAATHIRVIRIKPGCGEEIRCVMKRMRRTADRFVPIYSCLSYTWQPENPRRNIYIEKKRGKERVKSIGKNLGDFLSAARDANITDWLWIDALCINQADPIEKGQQVRRMGQTYKHARKVFVWLGLIPKPTVHALENLMRVNLEATKAANQASLGGLISIIPKEAWLGPLTDICSAPYWTRLWIAQEFLLANEPILFFQNFQIDAITLARQLNRFLYLVPKGERLDFMALTGWTYLHWRWVCYEFPSNNKWMPSERRPMDKPVSLASLIPKFAKSGCHDKKDRVYALLSLADDGDPGMVYYEISEDEVFRNTMGVMKRHKNKRPIDEHLLIGEALIEALELWPATSPSSSTLEINFDGPEDITLPIWGRAALEIKAEAGTGWETIEATCIF
ncbi:hypothetical protein CDV36_002280 [Fusarium kuroshium]|uniref:Heterokaryon incompatibility domain-containing protein n=1 Tax=Fusarium kuroshium TaxID=2010991 RepID=A0A3M2SKF4_9HYPO|nr:hypothetical protein CDV36_002280 [Fusarium kuroshium]